MKTLVGDFVSGKPVKFFKSRRLAREFLGNNGNGVKDVYGNGWDIVGNPKIIAGSSSCNASPGISNPGRSITARFDWLE